MALTYFSEEDFSCPVCCDIYKDPVILTCTHSVCNVCLKKFWESKGSRECPVCRRRSSKADLPLNLVLKNLCETYLQQRSHREPFCILHHSELKLFCEDDKQLVCLVCRDSKLHKKHNFSPIPEAALEHKEEMKIKLQPIRKKLDNFKQAKKELDETATHIRVQAQHTERYIKEEFEKIHKFLQDEEAARIVALREEEKQKSQMIKQKIEDMSREIASLSQTIGHIEEKMGDSDITLLQNYMSTVERAQCTLQNPERISGSLINMAKHLGNLKFQVWVQMQEIVKYTPVILDPNTAHPELVLSEDLTSVRISDERQQFPDNPERFDRCLNILGSFELNSGIHFWDVEVGDSQHWGLGVITQSGQRKGVVTDFLAIWGVGLNDGEYGVIAPYQENIALSVMQKPQRIRVQLDLDRGKLSFSDFDNEIHLHTFTHKFTERVFPIFSADSLRILPVDTEVTVKQHSWS